MKIIQSPFHMAMDIFNPKAVDQLLNEAFDSFDRSHSKKAYNPLYEWVKAEKEYQLTIELPGVLKEEVSLSVEHNNLSISGERRGRKEEKNREVLSTSIGYGKFDLKFTLPLEADADQIKATFAEGLLEVKIPITPKAQKQIVAIS